MPTAEKNVLLVLDDEPMIVRLIMRTLKKEFEKILYASTPAEAEVILNNHRVTHFVCDSNLGPEQPPGIDFIDRWYASYPHLKKAILFTGMAVESIPPHSGIMVVSKSSSPQVLLQTLRDSLLAPAVINMAN